MTGGSSEQSHLGNILAHSEKEFLQDARIAPRKRTDLVGLLDTTPYPNDKSDVVALLVLEHQTTVYNLITRLNFKARTLLSRESPGAESTLPWESLQPRTQEAIRHMAEPLVQAMLFSNAAPIAGKIAGSSFDALPDCARQFIYRRLADILDGRDQSAASARLSVQDRTAVAQILTATKPEFANTLRQEPLR